MMETKGRTPAQRNVRTAEIPRGRRLRLGPLAILGVAYAYALVRYVVFGDTAAAQIPLYVTNKAVAAGAVVYLLMAGLSCARRDRPASRAWGRWALHSAGVHALISVLLLSAAYYPSFFGDALLRFGGEASLLCAALALYCFATVGRLDEAGQRRRALTAGVLTAGHLLFYGYAAWTSPATWFGGLPPISLLTFFVAAGAVAAYAVALRRR